MLTEQILTLKKTIVSHEQQVNQEVTTCFRVLECKQVTQQMGVYSVIETQSGQVLTLKVIAKQAGLHKDRMISEIKNQQIFLGRLNFVGLIEVYEDAQSIYLLMERWGPTLSELIQRRGSLTEYETQLVFSQLVDAIADMRASNIAHNNITLDSIYVDLAQPHKLKLGDFSRSFNIKDYFEGLGQSRDGRRGSHDIGLFRTQILPRMPTAVSSHYDSHKNMYSSPEEFLLSSSSQYSRLNIVYENDLWCVGIILFRLLVGRFPFQQDLEQIRQQNLKDMRDGKVVNQQNKENNYNSLNNPSNSENYPAIQKIKQCSYNFQTSDRESYRSSYNEAVSLQFKQLIQSLLKPEARRIKLKNLLNHPLKLVSYQNILSIDFTSQIIPLFASHHCVYQQLKDISRDLQEYLIKRENCEASSAFCNDIQYDTDDAAQSSQQDDTSSDRLTPAKTSQKSQYQANKLSAEAQKESMALAERYKYISSGNGNHTVFQLFKHANSNEHSFRSQIARDFDHNQYDKIWNMNFAEQDQFEEQYQEANLIRVQSATTQQGQSLKQNLHTVIPNIQNLSNCTGDTLQRQNIPKHTAETLQKQQFSPPQYYRRSAMAGKVAGIKNKISSNKMASFCQQKDYNLALAAQSSKSATKSVSIMYKKGDNHSMHSGKINSQNSKFNIRNINQKYFGLGSSFGTSGAVSRNTSKLCEPANNLEIEFSRTANQHSPNAQKQVLSNQFAHYGSNKLLCPHGQFPNQELQKSRKSHMNFESEVQYNYPINRDLVFESVRNLSKSKNQQPVQLSYQYKDESLIMKSRIARFPIFVEEPYYVLKYRHNRAQAESESLGYVLNNSVGVIFKDGTHLMGHNQKDFVIISQSRVHQWQEREDLGQQKVRVYSDYLRLFGTRMVMKNHSLWIQNFWHDGRVYIFLFSNGSWQVTFQDGKTSRFFVLDENDLIWSKSFLQIDIANKVRNIVNRKKKALLNL